MLNGSQPSIHSELRKELSLKIILLWNVRKQNCLKAEWDLDEIFTYSELLIIYLRNLLFVDSKGLEKSFLHMFLA